MRVLTHSTDSIYFRLPMRQVEMAVGVVVSKDSEANVKRIKVKSREAGSTQDAKPFLETLPGLLAHVLD